MSHSKVSGAGFMEGALVALILSAAGTALLYAFEWLLPFSLLSRLLIAGLGLAYILYLFSRSEDRAGRITVLLVYMLASLSSWLFAVPIIMTLMLHIGLVWLIRSLYRYSSVLSALLDLALVAVSMAVTVATWLHTGNVFLALWSFFLLQALYVAIPLQIKKTGAGKVMASEPDRFQRAKGAAESALRKLSSQS